MTTWGLMDNYIAIVLPFVAHASTIFFFRQYLLGLPKSLLEAGRSTEQQNMVSSSS